MIGYIRGLVTGIYKDSVILENNGIGYRVFTSSKSIVNVDNGDEATFHTHLYVREDEMTLYGFTTYEEIELFKKLISISGIGPKAALSILSELTVKEFMIAVMTSDTKSITRANGVGPKVASRIVLELKDKLDFDEALSLDGMGTSEEVVDNSVLADTVLALVSLGISDSDARRAISKVAGAAGMDSGKLLKEALKNI
ncbi:MAG: Holliday junction branch migration protein RuvA [Lachnospiraceae bacterium]|jgi:Holliday junction DNA helicase RuvA|nr:Holliday junction branch migration protein RuvA [Lachnospiraceae bacterium]